MEEMNKGAQDRLNDILDKRKNEMTEDEIRFVRARRSYLTETQEKELKDELSVEEESKPVEKMTKVEVTAELDKREVKYDSKAKLDELRATLVEEMKKPA